MSSQEINREILIVTEGFAVKVNGSHWEKEWNPDKGAVTYSVYKHVDPNEAAVNKSAWIEIGSFASVLMIGYDDEIQALTVNVEPEDESA